MELVNIDICINLMRFKKRRKETNPELEYQLKTQRNKLRRMGINTENFENEN